MSERTPLDAIFDVLLYAPIGAAIRLRDELPDLVREGRDHAAERFPLYRTIGEFAVSQAAERAEAATGPLAEIFSAVADLLDPDGDRGHSGDHDVADDGADERGDASAGSDVEAPHDGVGEEPAVDRDEDEDEDEDA